MRKSLFIALIIFGVCAFLLYKKHQDQTTGRKSTPPKKKVEFSDYTIDNSGSAFVIPHVLKILSKINK